ncbi:hypothetical protein [uncultured Dokdonia sp.]|uniref:hypothetical protein n=1 Tax=uncultured Dokdonia sp. TaxID=575653 RepID=UPI0026070F7D|nr:hypothetical protein [uncultured Dokdonia sp.]
MLAVGTKIKAGALQFAILISVVIAVILSAFILISYSHLQFAKQLERSTNTIKLSHDGIGYAKQKSIPYGDSISINLEEGIQEEVIIFKTHWGIFDKMVSIGKSRNFKTQKIALLGGQTPEKERPAIFLEDSNSPLVVVGETSIYGDVSLPRQGIKPGNIAGNYYQGKTLVNGNINQNNSAKPQISNEKKEYIKTLLFGNLPQEDSLFIRSLASEISSTFETAPKWIYSPDVIQIDDQSISQNIIIKSDTLIRVSAFAKAENIILIAPHIEIADNAIGAFQAFASKSITVGKNARLTYPSALVFQEKENQVQTSNGELRRGITLEEGSIVSGSVIHLESPSDNYQKALVTIKENAIVQGEVYSDHIVQLEGNVKGSIYTRQFAIETRGSVYKNHLFDAIIDTRNFPVAFCGIETTQTQTNLVQWVY